MTTTTVDSVEVREIAPGERIKYSAWFGPILYGDTLTTVASITQTSGTTTLTIGTSSINTGGTVSVDGKTREASTVVQFLITAPASAVLGEYVIEVFANTAANLIKCLRCRLRVV